jgi:hypothetical protein
MDCPENETPRHSEETSKRWAVVERFGVLVVRVGGTSEST